MNLKEYMIDYVGNKHNPDTDDVTVDMVVETLAEEFPEFLLMVAEENYIRGYEQALDDVNSEAVIYFCAFCFFSYVLCFVVHISF